MTRGCPRPHSRHRPGTSTNCERRTNVPFVTSECPSCLQIQPSTPLNPLLRMSPFDLTSVRKAVAEFTPRRPEKFQDLLPAKEVISELRTKRASYRAIAELLTQHCLPTSKTAIAVFCHKMLGEIVRPRRRPTRRQASAPVVKIDDPPKAPQPSAVAGSPGEAPGEPNGDESQQTRTRGPRIAQVRMLKPENT